MEIDGLGGGYWQRRGGGPVKAGEALRRGVPLLDADGLMPVVRSEEDALRLLHARAGDYWVGPGAVSCVWAKGQPGWWCCNGPVLFRVPEGLGTVAGVPAGARYPRKLNTDPDTFAREGIGGVLRPLRRMKREVPVKAVGVGLPRYRVEPPAASAYVWFRGGAALPAEVFAALDELYPGARWHDERRGKPVLIAESAAGRGRPMIMAVAASRIWKGVPRGLRQEVAA